MLEKYFSILKKERPAVHWISQNIDCGIEIKSASDEELESLNIEKSAEALNLAKSGGWRDLGPTGEETLLDLKIELARRMLSKCRFCERRCKANRIDGKTGYCGVGSESHYTSDFLHMGEEPELVPSHTIFFSGCTFRCVYCQNWDIAMNPQSGWVAEPETLSAVLIEGLSQGSKNANFVGGNPDPNLHTILETIRLLGEPGMYLPIVWNSNMYTSLEAMRILNGVVDIYLGDFRYGNDNCARALSDVDNYFSVVPRNFRIAYETAEVMLRHLVIPGHLECCTKLIMEWVKENIPGVYFNLMFQYRPDYRASLHPEIDRRLSFDERKAALEMAEQYGIAHR
ncbi:MAG: radical SAM protein [Actinomycetota bacterium]|nr:radical SAM protein [Actinomycetota bacterium]